ncbi:hypothetical protein GAY27_21645 [Azospirillum brasilense]|nr:hypothetical protein [Azospirillum brasilense]
MQGEESVPSPAKLSRKPEVCADATGGPSVRRERGRVRERAMFCRGQAPPIFRPSTQSGRGRCRIS